MKRAAWLLGTGLAFASVIALHAAPKSLVEFPDGYRSWMHVKSGITDSRSPNTSRHGVHHIYANAKALEGMRNGKYADGAVLVFDVLELKPNNVGSTEGPRKLVDVMVRDVGRFAETGGWGFEEYLAADLKKPVLSDAAKSACFGCHTGMKKSEYVFSVLRD